jgi:hypothetical protein
MRYRRYTNLNGHQVEFASELILPHARYFRRESKSQKAQVDSVQQPNHTAGRKRPMNEKLKK